MNAERSWIKRNQNSTISTQIGGSKPSTFALNKLQQFKYIELNYFAPKGCSNAHAEHEKTANNDTFSITWVNEIIILQLISSLKTSKDICRDKDLPWDEMIMAKNMMLHFITKSRVWQKEHVHSLVAFFVVLKNHPMHYQELGNKTILHYISCVCQEWFDPLKRNKGFNLQLINEDLMWQIADEVKDTARTEELCEVSIFL